MLWCGHCLRLCSTLRQGDFTSCSACGKVLADREMAVIRSGGLGSKRVCNDAADAAVTVCDTTDTDDSDCDSEQSSS